LCVLTVRGGHMSFGQKMKYVFSLDGLLLMAGIFVVELLVMIVLDLFDFGGNDLIRAVLDSVLLTILILPVVHKLFIIPVGTQRKKNIFFEMDLIRKNRALDTVNDLLIKTLESRNHKELSKVIAKKLKNISESDFCLIGMLDHKKQFEVLALSDTVLSGDDLAQEKERLRKTDLTVFNGWLLPLINNEVVLVNDLANNIANLIFPSFLPESHSLLAIPLSMSDHKFGFVILAKLTSPYSDAEKDAVLRMVPFLTSALDKKIEDTLALESKGVYI